ncbi:MAG: hypothetical protein U0269_02715 [Polyangiales bacterium]
MSEDQRARWIQVVDAVLARRALDARAREAVVDALRNAPDALRAQLFVEGRAPVDGGIIAPTDAKLVYTARGFELFVESYEQALYKFRVDPSRLLVPDGARVRAGQLVKAGDVHAESWIEVFGDDGRAKVIEAACEQTGLSRALAEVLTEPMFGGVRVKSYRSEQDEPPTLEGTALRRWRDGTRMTERRFGIELIAAYEFAFERAGLGADPRVLEWKSRSVEDRAKSALPYEWFSDAPGYSLDELPVGARALLDYRALARMDDEGLVLDHEPTRCGSFEIASGTISVGDASVVERRPLRDVFEAQQLSFGAVRGRWNVLVTRHHDGRLAMARVWHEGARPWMRAASCARIEYGSNQLLVCDLSKANVDRARSSAFSEERSSAMNAGNVAVFDGLGVVLRGRDRRRYATVRVQRGFEDRVEAMEITL